jgi:hypothetical protein
VKRKPHRPRIAPLRAHIHMLEQIIGALAIREGGRLSMTKQEIDSQGEAKVEMHIGPEGFLILCKGREAPAIDHAT